MGLFIGQHNSRSELQEKIAAELREKAKRSQLQENAAMDGVDDIKYLEGTKQTTSLAWAWVLIVLLAEGVITMILMQG